MQVIYKFQLELVPEQIIELTYPLIDCLTVQLQNNIPTLWAIVNPESDTIRKLKVEMFGTGREDKIIGNKKYLGTIQKDGFVWHFFWSHVL